MTRRRKNCAITGVHHAKVRCGPPGPVQLSLSEANLGGIEGLNTVARSRCVRTFHAKRVAQARRLPCQANSKMRRYIGMRAVAGYFLPPEPPFHSRAGPLPELCNCFPVEIEAKHL